MDEQANLGVVRQCYDAFAQGDTERLRSYFDPDISWEIPTVPGVAFSGRRQGCDQVMAFFREMGAAQETRAFQPNEFIAKGPRVVVLGHYAFMIRATGACFESDWVHLFTVRDGKITDFREFLDSHLAAAAYCRAPS